MTATQPRGHLRQRLLLNERGVARALGAIVLGAGVLTMLSALGPRWWERLRLFQDLLTPWGSRLASGAAALLGAGLIFVGRGVMARRRLAFRMGVGLLAGTTVVHVLHDVDLPAAGFTALAALLLVQHRRVFVIDPGPARLRSLLVKALAFTALVFAYGLAGLAIHARVTHPHLTFLAALQEVAARLVGGSGPLAIRGRFGRWFPASITALGAAGGTTLLVLGLGPIARRHPAPAAERAEVARLLDRPDADTVDPFVLRCDKSYVFSSDRRAAIGYRYVGGVGLASGDPVGHPDAFQDAVARFLEVCDSHGWRPAVYGTRWDRAWLYDSFGLRSFYIGDEAIIDVAGFTLEGPPMRAVRQPVNRTHNFGVTTEICREGDLSPDLRDALCRIASIQRGDAPERGFSMMLGDLLAGTHPECLVVVARDRDGAAVAFQRYVPCRTGRALSLDVMRRLPNAPNGVNERMIYEVVEWGRARNVEEVSLNFAALRTLLSDEDEQAWTWVIRSFEGRLGLQMDTLRRFNEKFRPRWVPRRIAFRSPVDLPAIALATLSAEGFLPFDSGRSPAPTVRA